MAKQVPTSDRQVSGAIGFPQVVLSKAGVLSLVGTANVVNPQLPIWSHCHSEKERLRMKTGIHDSHFVANYIWQAHSDLLHLFNSIWVTLQTLPDKLYPTYLENYLAN